VVDLYIILNGIKYYFNSLQFIHDLGFTLINCNLIRDIRINHL